MRTVRFTVIWSPHFSFSSSFSIVSTPIFATKTSFFSVFRTLLFFRFQEKSPKRFFPLCTSPDFCDCAPFFAEEIFKYLSISKSEFPVASKQFEEPILTLKYFNDLCDTFRSPHIWKYDNGKWVLRVPLK